eukprot:m51a1_g4316 hypothetical protein (315) ;mRNA; f:51834-52778
MGGACTRTHSLAAPATVPAHAPCAAEHPPAPIRVETRPPSAQDAAQTRPEPSGADDEGDWVFCYSCGETMPPGEYEGHAVSCPSCEASKRAALPPGLRGTDAVAPAGPAAPGPQCPLAAFNAAARAAYEASLPQCPGCRSVRLRPAALVDHMRAACPQRGASAELAATLDAAAAVIQAAWKGALARRRADAPLAAAAAVVVCHQCGGGVRADAARGHFGPCAQRCAGERAALPGGVACPELPRAPAAGLPGAGCAREELREYNREARARYFAGLPRCDVCGRRVAPRGYAAHRRRCRRALIAERPSTSVLSTLA